MTVPAQFATDVRAWLNFDYSDDLIDSFARVAFETMSETLRCAHMVTIETAEIDQDRVLLPIGWLEMDFIRLIGGEPLRFRSRDDFYNTNMDNDGYYTVTGNYLIIGGSPTDSSPKQVELSYFKKLASSFDDTYFMFTDYYSLSLFGTLAASAAYSEDDENAAKWNAAADSYIAKANEAYIRGRTAGSRLRRPRRHGFG